MKDSLQAGVQNEEGSRKLYSLVNEPHKVNDLQEVEEYEKWLYARLMLVLLVYIYIAADYYDVACLRARVTRKFFRMTKESLFWDTREFIDAIPLIYANTLHRKDEEGLRDLVVDVVSMNRTDLFRDKQVMDMINGIDDIYNTMVLHGHLRMDGEGS
jgi:hypothetical protein